MKDQTQWIERARAVLPAGGFGNFDSNVVISHGLGSKVWDQNGNEYIDYLLGSGPMILGHGHPEVVESIQEQLSKGVTFFANNTKGIELAEEIVNAVPCAEQLRYVSTGGEADMYAIRLARAFTGKDKILKFEGGYHGMSAEALMSLAPKELRNFPQAVPDSAGIPESVRESMVIAPFNDSDAVTALLDEFESEIAAIIVEPLQRLIPPAPGFLQALREQATKRGIVLIFDDFDQSIVGQSGFTYQIGTLSGNPLAAAAGLKTLEILRRDDSYQTLTAIGKRLMHDVTASLNDEEVPHRIVGEPMLFDVLFTNSDVLNYRDVVTADSAATTTYNNTLREHGIFKSPGKMYPSLALTESDLVQTEEALRHAAMAVNNS